MAALELAKRRGSSQARQDTSTSSQGRCSGAGDKAPCSMGLRLALRNTSSCKVLVFSADSNSGTFQEQGCPFPKGVDPALALINVHRLSQDPGWASWAVHNGDWALAAPSLPSGLGAGHGLPSKCRQFGGGALLAATLGPRQLSIFLPQQSATAIRGSGGLVWTLWPKIGWGSGYP